VPRLTKLTLRTVPLYEQVRAAASCQNEVILPWTKDKIVDPDFPTFGPVYEESTKPLVGLAGESRSGDANGQWFRVLAAGGNYVASFKPGTFTALPAPILGANPPKPDARPPLNPSVPCETQEKPNLTTVAGGPPVQHKVDTTSPAYRARYAEAKLAAVKWLRKQLKLEGLGKQFSVVENDVTKAVVDQLAKARGGKP
jgi:hypothetical protein